ncbi:MAG TPA: DUF4238 domain-containing protein [Chloroflexota bacterium]|nr:DUF4238 domain-containing protein [Chloroflexota bacterium]
MSAHRRTEPRRQHTVPRVHLKRFVDPTIPPDTWVYEKGRPGPQQQPIRALFRLRDYYTLRHEDRTRDYSIETDLHGGLEDAVEPVLQKLVGRAMIAPPERHTMVGFLASLRTRVPPFHRRFARAAGARAFRQAKELASDPVEFEQVTRKLIQAGRFSLDDMTIQELRQAILGDDESNWRMDSVSALIGSVFSLEIIARQIAALRWLFIEAAADKRFVTSDNPVVIADPKHRIISFFGTVPLGEGAFLTFPVSPDLALVATPRSGPEGFRKGSPEFVHAINEQTILGAAKLVCADHESVELDALVQQLAHDEKHPWPLCNESSR